MKGYARRLGTLAGLLALGAAQGAAQTVHEIRLVAKGKGEFRFVPASTTVSRGDVVLFKVESGAPHSVVFEGKDLPGAERQKLNAAMPRRAGDLSSPLLTEGAEYRVVLPALAKGTYRFFCLPHRAYDMRGELVVK
jgi:plastocyanin